MFLLSLTAFYTFLTFTCVWGEGEGLSSTLSASKHVCLDLMTLCYGYVLFIYPFSYLEDIDFPFTVKMEGVSVIKKFTSKLIRRGMLST